MLWELSAKRFEENRGNRKLCHLNPFEFLEQRSFTKPELKLCDYPFTSLDNRAGCVNFPCG